MWRGTSFQRKRLKAKMSILFEDVNQKLNLITRKKKEN